MAQPARHVIHVAPDAAGQTLAALLRRNLAGRSWGDIQRLLRARHVQVNGNLCVDAGRRLKAGEVVKLLPQSAAPPPRADDVRIRHLDAHVVVVEKPAGVTSNRHAEERQWSGRRKQLQPTLDELLPRTIARVESWGRGKPAGNPPPVRAVHRLDRDTSGLMVFARTVRAERALGEQFRRHTTERRYLAVVLGRIDRALRFDSQFVRDRGDGRRGSARPSQRGKQAVTHVRPVEALGDYTLVECRLETGRTHQIRIHLSEAGHPVCGDRVYRQPRVGGPVLADSSDAPRLALHAAELGFEHPATGEKLRFAMPLPAELERFVARLRSAGGPHAKARRRKDVHEKPAD
jgi:23S rRNA pseudouridine1911/1915/1917 synthase